MKVADKMMAKDPNKENKIIKQLPLPLAVSAISDDLGLNNATMQDGRKTVVAVDLQISKGYSNKSVYN